MGGTRSKPTPTSSKNFTFPNNKCRILILGKTGTGKSSTGNMLLGREVFNVRPGMEGGTDKCQRGTAKFLNTTLEVTDTPGIFHPNYTLEKTEDLIAKGLVSLHPGPNIILFTISCRARFTDEEYKSLDKIKELMGSKVSDYMIIVFTGADKLDSTIEETLLVSKKKSTNATPADVAFYARAHYVTFNNKLLYKSDARNQQIEKLLQIAERIVSVNPQEHFCNTMSERITKIVTMYVSEECARTGKNEEEVMDKMKQDILLDDKPHAVIQKFHQLPNSMT